MAGTSRQRTVSIVLFEGFELLDVFGPAEVFGSLPEYFELALLGPTGDAVASAQGPRSEVDHRYSDAAGCDIVLVPGGIGTRTMVHDGPFLDWLRQWSLRSELVTSVCTGSAVLAAAGLLDGYRATSNKRAFSWAVGQGTAVDWVPEARWVEDRDRWTSSGVTAGIDMAFAIVASLHGEERSREVADRLEYERHTDASTDPFARLNGLAGADG